MSGIIHDIVDCPQCGLPAQKDEYYVIGEEKVACNWCGYNHFKSLNGTEVSRGYGSIHYISKNTSGSNQKSIMVLKEPMDILQRHKIIMHSEECKINGFYVWNEDRLDCLIGKMPQTLEEEYEDRRQEANYYRETGFASIHNDTETKEFNSDGSIDPI